MANSLFVFVALLASFLAAPATSSNDAGFIKPMDMSLLGAKHEKLSHFRVYWHDVVSGDNPTTTTVIIPPANNSKTFFGLTRMIDNPLTLGPKLSSKCVGRAQGFYASAALDEMSLYMSMNFEFIEGKYNGSTITIQGRNPVFDKVREMPVIGGSGLFRFARGYAKIKTVWFDTTKGNAVVEYNVYVLHY